jgi:hypothetical protein
MKKLFTQILALSGVVLLMLPSCKKDETKVVATSGVGATLTASATTLSLTKANATSTAVTFSLTPAAYNYSAAITNTLQIDVASDNFASPKSISLPANTLTQSYATIDFNAMLLALNLKPGTSSTIQARLMSSISPAIKPVYSNVVTMTVTPYALVSFVYVPGAYQGWNPSTADSLQSPTSNGIYSGIINFTPGNLQFKITPVKNWNNSYGTSDGSSVVYNGGNNLYVNAPGSTLVTLNLNNNTYTAVPNLWSIIGDATVGGWSTDTDMSFNNGTQVWTIKTTLTGGGNVKFRLNHDWGTNLGGSNGTLSLGGANIPIATSGTYTITLNVAADTYTITQ